MLKSRTKTYTVWGYDAFGVPVVETITVTIQPMWKRAARWIGRRFGMGIPRNIARIVIQGK